MGNDFENLIVFFVFWMIFTFVTMILVAVIISKIRLLNRNIVNLIKMLQENTQQNKKQIKITNCPQCNSVLLENASFCTSCGKKII